MFFSLGALVFFIATGLNTATELVVKTTLSDRVVWYKAWHDDIQSKSKARAPLSVNTVANRLQSISKEVCMMYSVQQ